MNTSRDKLGQALCLKEVYAACLSVMMGVVPAYAQQSGNTTVGNFQVQAGNAAIAASADPQKVVINLSNNKSVLQWDRLNVPIGATLQFSQPNAQSVVLNRVVSVDPARIDGVMNSNGQVWLLSGSGVLFGPNSQVNVSGLLASTRDISNTDFLAGNYSLSGGGAGKVSNLGDISVADGGYVLLVGSEVDNQGRIQAQLGQVKLASGKAFVLDLHGDKLLRFDVTEALTGGDGQAAKVNNAGQIVADGGSVQLTGRAASGLVAQVVNTGGLLQANSARWVNGQIVLDAGPGGEVVAGGQISTQGLDAATSGGSVTVVGDKITLPNDSRINASGQAGGGTVLVGGDWQGSGSLQQATTVDMQAGAEIKANATTVGDGGKVVLWSKATDPTTSTTVAGDIEARGAGGGRGGNVETSGGQLNVSGNVVAGAGGHWLLDPTDVVVDNALSTSIVSSLNNATDVTVQATGGELRVEADVTTTSSGTNNATLTLDGSNASNVRIQRRVTVDDGINVVVNSGGDVRFESSDPYYSSGIETASGNITINANDYLFTTTRNMGDAAALKTLSGTISTTSRVAVLGHGSIDVTGAGKATVLTTGVSAAGEVYALPAGLGVAFYMDGSAAWTGYGSKYVDGTNSIVRIRDAGKVLVNATQGLVTSGNYSDGSNTFTAYDPASINDPIAPTVTGLVNRILRAEASSSSFVLAGPQISIPQWKDLSGAVMGYVYSTAGGTLGFVSMDGMSANVGNYFPARIDNEFAIVNLASLGTSVTYDGTTHSASGAGSLVQLASPGGMAYSSSGGVPSTSLSLTSRTLGVNAGSQSIVIDNISFGGNSLFNLPIVTTQSVLVQKANLTVTANAASKTYDGLSWSGGNGVTYSGLASTDTSAVLGGALAWGGSSQGAKSVGTYALTPSGYTSNNYNIAYVGSSLSINRAALTVTASSANKTYDGTTTAPGSATVGVLAGAGAGEYVASATQSFTNKNAGTGKTVQATGVTIKDGIGNEVTSNYQITYADDQTGVITPAPLTLAADAQTKIFDGTVASTKTPNVLGLQTGDSVTGSTQVFDAAAVGARTLSVASYTVNDGNNGDNYAVTLQTANGAINAAPVTTQTVEETASQSVQIAVASATSSLTQLSAATSSTAATTVTPQKTTAVTTAATSSTTGATGTTSTTGTTTPSTPVTAQTGTTTTTPTGNTATTTETASISVSNQAAPTANLNAPNAATTQTQTAAATGTAATEAKPQVTMVSMTALSVNTPTSVGAQTIAAIPTPTAPEDQRDPVLAAVSSFKPPVVLAANSGRAANTRGQNQPVVVPLVQGVLALETVPPKAASQTVDEQRLSGAGNRSRW